jgi:PCI domain
LSTFLLHDAPFLSHILFVGALAPNDYGLLRQGTYLLLERCKTVCYRSLIKRIHLLNNKSTIPLDQVVAAFLWLNIHIDIDEVECILANLIYRGIIRGYIAHTKRMLVLSKSNAFPVENIGR